MAWLCGLEHAEQLGRFCAVPQATVSLTCDGGTLLTLNVWLKRALCQAAWSAARKKDSYFQAQYRRLAARRGKKRAAMAVGHSLLEVIYHLLRSPELEYHDLGGDYFDKLDPQRLSRHLVKRLESLGFEVTLHPAQAA